MAEFSVIKLKNLSPFHIGTGKENYDFSSSRLHSDTLSSALAAIRVQLGKRDDVNSFLQSFSISSAFPFYKDVLFMPKPQGRIPVEVEGEKEYMYRKQLKKVQYLELGLWKKMINGEKLTVNAAQIVNDYIVGENTILPRLYDSQVNERVFVPRNNNDTEPFFFEWTYCHQDAGLFVLTDATGIQLEEICELMKVLGEQGIGTDKNVGGGKFEPQFCGTLNVESPTDANACLLLSLYIPQEEEFRNISLDGSLFTLRKRGGYIAGSEHPQFRHLRKRSVFMFDVGSVLKTSHELIGKVVDLRPDWNDPSLHPVYRSGRALCLPIKL